LYHDLYPQFAAFSFRNMSQPRTLGITYDILSITNSVFLGKIYCVSSFVDNYTIFCFFSATLF
jgi:hypothetical protein